MKKTLLRFIGAAMLWVVFSSVNAGGLPTYMIGPDLPGGVVSIFSNGSTVSVDASLPEGHGVVGVYVAGGNSPAYTLVNRGTNSVSGSYTPSGTLNVLGVGTFNARVTCDPPGLQDGLVTFTSSGGAWDFGTATNLVAVAIIGDPSGEATWVVAYRPPPTAVEVPHFGVTEVTSYVTNRVKKTVTVTVSAKYSFIIGNVTGNVAGFVIQEEWATMFSGPFWSDKYMVAYSPGLAVSGSFTPYCFRTGNYRLVAVYADNTLETVATANSIGGVPPPL